MDKETYERARKNHLIQMMREWERLDRLNESPYKVYPAAYLCLLPGIGLVLALLGMIFSDSCRQLTIFEEHPLFWISIIAQCFYFYLLMAPYYA